MNRLGGVVMSTSYRVNYGNGQVSEAFTRLRDAERHRHGLTDYRAYAFIQCLDPDTREWFTYRDPLRHQQAQN